MAIDPGLYEEAGRAWGVDPHLLMAQEGIESGGNDRALSSAGAQGRMQIMPDTARALGVTDTSDPVQSVFGAAKLMRQNLDATNGDVVTALRLYQGGPNRAGWGPQNAAYPGQVLGKLKTIKAQAAQAGSASSAAPASGAADSGDTFSTLFGSVSPADKDDATIKTAVDKLRAQQAGGTSMQVGSPAATSSAAATSPDAAPDAFSTLFGQAMEQSAAPPSKSGTATSQDAPVTIPAPADSPATPQQPMLARVGAGIQQGFMDVAGTGAKAIANVGQWVNDRVPFMAALDAKTGMSATDILKNVDQSNQAYDKQFGGDGVANMGRLGGNMLATLPVMGGVNALAGTAGGAVFGNTGRALMTGQTGGNMLARGASMAVQGATLGAAGEAAVGNDPTTGAITGAVMGPAAGLGMNALAGTANRLLGRGASAVAPDVAQLADLAQTRYRIPLRADQLSSSGAVKMAGDVVNRLPMTGGSEFTATQLSAYNRAIANTIGESADALTPDVMSRARTRIGAAFDHVENNMSVPADTTLLNELGRIESTAQQSMSSDQADIISRQVTNILEGFTNGNSRLDGPAFRNFVKRGTPLDSVANSSNPDIAKFGGQLQDALRDALDRSLPPGSALQQQYNEARQQWRNLQTIKQLAAKAPTGTTSPALMMGAALRNDPNMAFTGGGDLGDLARIGQQFLKPPANSGTPERSMFLNALTGTGQVLGAGLLGYGGNAVGGLPLAAASAGGSLMAGNLVASRLRDPDLVNRLIQSGLRPQLPAIGMNLLRGAQPYLSGDVTMGLTPSPNPAR